jgi:hypothetical protein
MSERGRESVRRVEQLREILGRNIQEALAIEIAFLNIFDF